MEIIEELIQKDIKCRQMTKEISKEDQGSICQMHQHPSAGIQGPKNEEKINCQLFSVMDCSCQTFQTGATNNHFHSVSVLEKAIDFAEPKLARDTVDGLFRNLNVHEQKLEVLRDAGEQIIVKTRELDQIASNLLHYGSNQLEPWRQNISMVTEGILNGARVLEARLDSTINGCAELEVRVNRLENELLIVKNENELLTKYIAELETRTVLSCGAERHDQAGEVQGEDMMKLMEVDLRQTLILNMKN